jgi:hypothetical protein
VSVTTITSAVGLLFAAVAAWGAWKTVRLTYQIRYEDDLRRLLGGLVSIEHAARELERSPGPRFDLQDKFRDGQAELERALALGVSVKGTFGAAVSGELQRLLDSLKVAEPLRERQETIADADHARFLLTNAPPPKLMPTWWRRLVYRAHRTTRDG